MVVVGLFGTFDVASPTAAVFVARQGCHGKMPSLALSLSFPDRKITLIGWILLSKRFER